MIIQLSDTCLSRNSTFQRKSMNKSVHGMVGIDSIDPIVIIAYVRNEEEGPIEEEKNAKHKAS